MDDLGQSARPPRISPWCQYSYNSCTGEWNLESPCSENEPHCPSPPTLVQRDRQFVSLKFRNRGDTCVELHHRNSPDSPTVVRITIAGEVVMLIGARASGRFPLGAPAPTDADDDCIEPGATINCDHLRSAY